MRVHARERLVPRRALRRSDPEAAAAGRRPHGARDRQGAARGPRRRRRRRCWSTTLSSSWHRPARLARGRSSARTASASRSQPATVVLAAGGRCFAEAARAGRALDQPSERDRRGDADRARRRRRGARPRRAPVPPERRRLARRRCRATRSRRRPAPTAPCCSTRTGEEFTDSLGPRDEVSRAIVDEVERGRGVDDAGRSSRRAGSTRRGSRRRTPRSRCRTCCVGSAARASIR